MLKFLTRCVLLAILLAVCVGKLDETVRRAIVWQFGEQTSMRAELGSAHIDLPGKKSEFVRFRLSDPKQDDRELIQIGSIAMRAATDDLLYRRQRVKEGIVHDIRMEIAGVGEGGAFSTDALLAKFRKTLPDWAHAGPGGSGRPETVDATNAALALLLGGANPDAAVAQLLAQFQSVALVDTLKKRWPQEATQLQAKADAVDTKIKQLQLILQGVDQARDKASQVRLVLEQLAAIEEEIRGVETLLRQTQERGNADFLALQAATKNDADRLKRLQAPKLDAAVLSDRIVGDTIREEYDKLLLWGDWARSLIEPSEKEQDNRPGFDFFKRLGFDLPGRLRGKTFRFDRGEKEPPDLAIDTLYLDGTILLGPVPVYFNGQVVDLAQPLEAGENPLVAQFAFSGRERPVSPVLTEEVRAAVNTPDARRAFQQDTVPDIFVTLKMDRTAGAELDRLEVWCPVYLLPGQRFGNPEEFAVDAALGFATLNAVLEFRGGDIGGQVCINQHDVVLRAVLPPNLRQTALAQLVTDTLAGIRSLKTEIKISGPRTAPVYTVTSDLGEQLAGNLDAALDRQWGAARTRLEQTLNKEVGDAASTINRVTRELGPALLKNLVDQQGGFDKSIADNATVNALVQSQLSQLSGKDRERVERFLQVPVVQELLKAGGAGEDAGATGAEQLGRQIESAIPSLLDKLRPPK